MSRHGILSFSFFTLFLSVAYAEEKPDIKKSLPHVYEYYYQNFGLTALQVIDSETHIKKYTEERMKIANTPNFDGYKLALQEFGLRQKVNQLLKESKVREAETEILSLLKTYPQSIEGNFLYAQTQALQESPSNPLTTAEQKKEHRKKFFEHVVNATLIIQSVKNGGNCTSFEDKCTVININEEHLVMLTHGFKPFQQDLVKDQEKKTAIDEIKAVNNRGETRTFYFDITLLSPFNPNSKYAAPLTHHSSGTPNGAP